MTPTMEPAALADPQSFCPTLSLRKTTEEGALLVDVRERDEVAALAFDVPDIVHIPLSEFERRFAELPRERQLILACAGGQRSLKAAYYLIYQGYLRVANMQDGMAKWLRKGFPVKARAGIASAAGCCTPTGMIGESCCGSAPSVTGGGREPSSGCCGGSADDTSASCCGGAGG
jgi:rhodanese-related sulfurtransferase